MTTWLDSFLLAVQTVEANGTARTNRRTLNFGPDFTVTDDGTKLTVGGGGGGGSRSVAIVDVGGGAVTLDTTQEAALFIAVIGATNAQRVVSFTHDPDPTGYVFIVATDIDGGGDGSIKVKCPSYMTGVVIPKGAVSLITLLEGALQAVSLTAQPVNATAVQGVAVDSAAPSDGDVLTYDAGTTQWAPASPAAPPTPVVPLYFGALALLPGTGPSNLWFGAATATAEATGKAYQPSAATTVSKYAFCSLASADVDVEYTLSVGASDVATFTVPAYATSTAAIALASPVTIPEGSRVGLRGTPASAMTSVATYVGITLS